MGSKEEKYTRLKYTRYIPAIFVTVTMTKSETYNRNKTFSEHIFGLHSNILCIWIPADKTENSMYIY